MSQATTKRERPWFQGRMRESLLDLEKGARVVFRKSKRETRNIGTTWWVIGPSSTERAFVLYRVSEIYGGRNLANLVRPAVDKTTNRALRAPPKLHNRYNRLGYRLLYKGRHGATRKTRERVVNTPIRSAPL